MKEIERFVRLARKHDAIVGAFSGRDFEESLTLLRELDAEGAVRYEFSRNGDTIARAYWTDALAKCEGCVSVYRKLGK